MKQLEKDKKKFCERFYQLKRTWKPSVKSFSLAFVLDFLISFNLPRAWYMLPLIKDKLELTKWFPIDQPLVAKTWSSSLDKKISPPPPLRLINVVQVADYSQLTVTISLSALRRTIPCKEEWKDASIPLQGVSNWGLYLMNTTKRLAPFSSYTIFQNWIILVTICLKRVELF